MRIFAIFSFAFVLVWYSAPHGPAMAERIAKATNFGGSPAKVRKLRALRRPMTAPAQIACTHGGCGPIPHGCGAEKEIDAEAGPTGFEVIVCPAR